MNIIGKKVVPYKIAIALKKLKFNEDCMFCYTSKLNDDFDQLWFSDQIWGNSDLHVNPKFCKNSDFGNEKSCTAPLWQDTIDWVFEKLDFYYPYLQLMIYSDKSGKWYQSSDDGNEELFVDFDNLEEATLKAIELCQKKK